MAGHHAVKYLRHAAVAKPHVDPKIRYASKFLGATMWFYIFYRIKEDGPVIFGQKLPFEHH
ncbi:uncharacterized protein CANTADRAFT_44254 [Suhomyces tanzawaensis NRRL Y-17324]|uniref:Uncharacterized protein n=1 Tax=Suhomyces tanzawaensis NRRL Y-17324 TaxID=984487 RepID=A0A1E4SS54_9ASCO|nr:uncharacterized protein CANTADRAFT_44254 [Suhomyces tanzawaensis NRRL Y-17324]ODV82331.1 hypothetical protein CANTADRAFT_44254 [Suhomyces tanzawaensis NRRL Y-17324]